MSDLTRSGSFQPSRVDRQTSRALGRILSQQTIAAAEEVARVLIIEDATHAALLSTSNISVLEEVLAARTPRAEERLRHIADAGALGMTEVVLSVARKYR